jgi:hypothetical protein
MSSARTETWSFCITGRDNSEMTGLLHDEEKTCIPTEVEGCAGSNALVED